jgi:hypothetical protein
LGDSNLEHIVDITTRATPHGLLDASMGFLGRLSLRGYQDGLDYLSHRTIRPVKQVGNPLTITSAAVAAGIRTVIRFDLRPEGLLVVEKELTNTGSTVASRQASSCHSATENPSYGNRVAPRDFALRLVT